MTHNAPATKRTIPGTAIAWLIAGFSVWATGFAALYGVHALGCQWGWETVELGPVTLQRAVLLGLWGAHTAAGLALFLPLRAVARGWSGPGGDFLRAASVLVTAAAVFATIWTGAPLLFLATC